MPLPMQLPERPSTSPTLVTPECAAPGCLVAGDQFTMVRCRRCKQWFCPEHIDPEAGVRLRRFANSLEGLLYYEGACPACRRGSATAH